MTPLKGEMVIKFIINRIIMKKTPSVIGLCFKMGTVGAGLGAESVWSKL